MIDDMQKNPLVLEGIFQTKYFGLTGPNGLVRQRARNLKLLVPPDGANIDDYDTLCRIFREAPVIPFPSTVGES